jgi:hypothetical protein
MVEVHKGGCLCGTLRYWVVGEPFAAGVFPPGVEIIEATAQPPSSAV